VGRGGVGVRGMMAENREGLKTLPYNCSLASRTCSFEFIVCVPQWLEWRGNYQWSIGPWIQFEGVRRRGLGIGDWRRPTPGARDSGRGAEKAMPTASICRRVDEVGQAIAAM